VTILRLRSAPARSRPLSSESDSWRRFGACRGRTDTVAAAVVAWVLFAVSSLCFVAAARPYLPHRDRGAG